MTMGRKPHAKATAVAAAGGFFYWGRNSRNS